MMDLEKLRPLHDLVLIKRDSERDKTPGGIWIPDSAKDKVNMGTVVSTGRGRFVKDRFVEVSIKPGDRVIFGEYAGSNVPKRLSDEDHLFVREDEILGVVEDEKEGSGA